VEQHLCARSLRLSISGATLIALWAVAGRVKRRARAGYQAYYLPHTHSS